MFSTIKEITPDLFICDIVNNNYRTAEVFHKHNIDFCCGAGISLNATCLAKDINEGNILEELQQSAKGYPNPEQWPVGFLIDYLINIHHNYFKDTIPAVLDYVDRFILNHYKKFPNTQQLQVVTQKLCDKINNLTKFESDSLFHYIKRILYAYNNNEFYGRLFIKTLRKLSAGDLEQYHAEIKLIILEIEQITENFSLAGNKCITHRVMLQKLHEFIDYTKQHLFIENKFLIPVTLRMENKLLEEIAEI